MIGAIIKLATEALALTREQWHYWTGGRTREQIQLESELEELYVQKRQALGRGDVVLANQLELDAQRLRRQIVARFPARS